MILADLKSLIYRLNTYCTGAMEAAAGQCLSRSHYEITVEHFLAALLGDARLDIALVLQNLDVNIAELQRGIQDALGQFPTGNSGRPVFAPPLLELVQDSWLISSLNLKEERIRSGAVLIAFLSRASFFAAGSYADSLRSLSRETITSRFGELTQGSIETSATEPHAAVAEGGESSEQVLAKFCIDFTGRAAAGEIDPVFGRDTEIRLMVDVLARRRKNNPIIVGDPGVGKTALVEGLALRVVEGDVPEILRGVRLLGLDLGLLEAGAGVKGEFENRLKSVIAEIKASAQPIILFIDEAHTLVAAGGTPGGNNAANLLKPALARGELRTIAATTWSEYKKYFEKDAALARRFQLIKLEEPSVDATVGILRGLKQNYEAVHHVTVRDDALVAAAELSDRYITGRQLPDKAVDLLDTSAARVKINLSARPNVLDDRERRVQMLVRERSALERDRDHGRRVDEKRLEQIELELRSLGNEIEQLRSRWQTETEAARKLIDLRADLARAVAAPDTPRQSALRKEIEAAAEALRTLQNGKPLVRAEVDPEVVARVVSDWTGIPLGKVLSDQAETVLNLSSKLRERVRGQDQALDIIAEVIRASKAGLKDPQQPIGVFLLAGPSGVGKTETALSIADLLFGGENSSIVLNMSEFQEKHTVSRLIGSPPGYVGYGEGGLLTEAVRQRPYSVVLLDEIEKAHPEVLNLFYQVFDKGTLSDGEGRAVDFKNTVVFLTSNLASEQLAELSRRSPKPAARDAADSIRPILSRYLKPALLARMTIAPYYELDAEVMKEIARLKLGKVSARLATSHHIALSYSDEVLDQIVARCTEVETGARNIDYILNLAVLPALSREILSRMTGGDLPSAARLELGDDKSFKTEFITQAQ